VKILVLHIGSSLVANGFRRVAVSVPDHDVTVAYVSTGKMYFLSNYVSMSKEKKVQSSQNPDILSIAHS